MRHGSRWLASLLASCLLTTAASAAASQRPSTELSASEIFAKARPSIVTIQTPSGSGSGVIVGSDGLIVTNLHVISGSPKLEVKLPNGDVYDTTLVAAVDERRDLAIIRIAGAGLSPMTLGDSELAKTGETVYAVGSPKGFELTISNGILSGVRNSDEGYRVLQITAAISPGSSGGALLNNRGELIGITTFKIRGGENLNFALPANYVKGLLSLSDAPITLAELNKRYTGRPASPVGPAREPLYPRLSVSYRSSRTGGRLLVNQMGETATITIYNANYQIVGNAVVTWNLDVAAFVGTAEVRYVCGSFDTRTIMIKSAIRYEVQEGGVLREGYERPIGLNCTRNQVKSWERGEDTWWP